MAIAFEETLKKNISEQNMLPVYILFGEDGYLKRNYTEKISKNIASDDDVFNYCRFGGDCDLQEVYDAAMQLPFMADKKCVILDDYDFEKCSKNDFERLCTLLSDMPDTTVAILRFDNVEIEARKSSKFKKIVAAAEKSGGMAFQLDHRKTPELVKMLVSGAAKRGCNMEASAARYLVETAGEDINLLQNELNKLCFYSKTNPITKETVDKVSVKTVEASIYNLSKNILNGDVANSLSVLDELFFMKIEPIIILSSVSSVYVDIYRVYTAKSQGFSASDVVKTFDYKNKAFLVDKAEMNLRKFDAKKLNLSFNALVEADRGLKSFGSDARIVLEQLIVRLIYILVKGESVD